MRFGVTEITYPSAGWAASSTNFTNDPVTFDALMTKFPAVRVIDFGAGTSAGCAPVSGTATATRGRQVWSAKSSAQPQSAAEMPCSPLRQT